MVRKNRNRNDWPEEFEVVQSVEPQKAVGQVTAEDHPTSPKDEKTNWKRNRKKVAAHYVSDEEVSAADGIASGMQHR